MKCIGLFTQYLPRPTVVFNVMCGKSPISIEVA